MNKIDKKRLAMLSALLPEGVHWGDPLTPEIVNEILQEAMEQIASSMVSNYIADLPS